MENKEKLISIKEGLEIIMKYDEDGDFKFIDKILNSEDETFDNPLPLDVFADAIHSNVSSYANLKTKKFKK